MLSALVVSRLKLTKVEKSRIVWKDSEQVAKWPIWTIGDSLVIPAPLRDSGKDSILAERESIVVNSGWRKDKEDGN